MKKPSLSLKSINILVFMVFVVFISLIGFEQYRYIKREFSIELQKTIETNTYQLQDYFKNSFDKLHYVFNKTAQLDLEKLKEVRDYFDTIDEPLEPIYKKLNENIIFGRYDVYLIDPDKVIARSTFPLDVGMDFKNYDYASRILDMVRKGVIPYHVSQPYFSSASNDFRKYLLALSKDGKFFVQISHNYFPLENIRNEILLLKERYPNVKSIDVVFSSNELIKRLDKVYEDKRDYFKKHEQDKREFLEEFAKNLELDLDIDRAMKAKDLVNLLFGTEKLRYRIDPDSMKAVVYSLSENIFNNDLNKEIIILKTVYDLHALYARYRSRLVRLAFVLGASFLLISVILFFVKRLFMDRLRVMADAMKHDRDIDFRNFDIREFNSVAEAINAYREKLKRKNRELETLSHTDPLTGVFNRRYFGKMLEQYIYEYGRYGRTFALLIFDIDDFKRINDEYGHDVGDKVLCEMSTLIAREIRQSDLFFRIGGEEFAILLEPVESQDARRIAVELCKSVARHRFLGHLHITISVGVSDFREGDDAISLFKRVDEYAYLSKQNGKNIVTADKENVGDGRPGHFQKRCEEEAEGDSAQKE